MTAMHNGGRSVDLCLRRLAHVPRRGRLLQHEAASEAPVLPAGPHGVLDGKEHGGAAEEGRLADPFRRVEDSEKKEDG